MIANIGIPENDKQEVAKILNTLLADEHVLYIKTRNYHWNVTGKDFFELHKLFESQYTELEEVIDNVAERVRQLGHFSLGTMSGFLQIARLLEGQDDSTAEKKIRNLTDDHETIIRTLRNEIPLVSDKYKDLTNADFLTGVLEIHEKIAWFLRAHLQ